jgi:2-haloacid dehalogenase
MGVCREDIHMAVSRRQFVNLAAGAAITGIAAKDAFRSGAPKPNRIRAVAFDAFPIFDPRPIASNAEERFPGHGGRLMEEWRRRQFEYTWLRTAADRYVDFWQVTGQALSFAATQLDLRLSKQDRDALMEPYLRLQPWPEVLMVLEKLRAAGLRLAFLSNFTKQMLDAAVASSGLQGFFEEHLSTDRVGQFKPSRRAYEMGVKALGMRREEIAFVASAGWDAAGAKWYGYPTVWINRTAADIEALDAAPDLVATSLTALESFVLLTG